MNKVVNQNNNSVTCKYCQSANVRKYGFYKDVQRYFCNDCKRKFKADSTLFHMKTPPEQISSALNLYYSGTSINEIRDFLGQEHSNKPSKKSVYGWIDKYSDLAIKTANGYAPVGIGDTFVADETVLDIDGQNVWMYDIIDEKTRFLLATRISLSRTTHDAQMLMESASKKAGKVPKVVITDKNNSYVDGIELALGADTEHIQSRPFAHEVNTQLIERFHGTLKGRLKVMRGLKSIGTAIQFTDAWLVYYNYFRPHESLGSRTPAEVAGIRFPYKNWAEIIRQPVSKEAEILTHKTPRIRVAKYRIKLPPTHIGRPRKRVRTIRKRPHVIPSILGGLNV